MPGFHGRVGCQGMAQRIRIELLKRRDLRAADEAVEQNRNAAVPGGKRRAEYRGKLTAAERGGGEQRIAEHRSMTEKRLIDCCLFARKAEVIHSRAAAGPARSVAPEQGRRNCCR